MTDREKVFDALRNCVTEPKCKDCPWEDCEKFSCKRVTVPVTLLFDALELLKEQEPKAIVYEGTNWMTGLPVAICPGCGKVARQFYVAHPEEETHFCPWCGQAVKWE